LNRILIVDDDDQLRKSFEKLLREEGYEVHGAASGEAGIRIVEDTVPDLVVVDVRLPGMNGLETFKAIKELEPKLPVIIMTAYGSTETAIEATRQGAFDYVLKPFDVSEILRIIKQALDAGRFMRFTVDMDAAPGQIDQEAIIGRSDAMQAVYKSIGRVAPTDATVLIRGESGTGKELIARAVYQYSQRADKPFLVINCVAIPETLLESELFGYEKGAFTGAVHRRIGKIEQANGGTIFLDEIGDMPLSLQAKILRLLQEKSIERLGGRQTIPVDVRIIAATNRDLEASISQGTFREDLYYRLKVITIWLPPLRERSADIALLTDYYLSRYSAELKLKNPGITDNALSLLSGNPWPGNIRELSNMIQKMLIFNRGAPIDADNIMVASGGRQPSPEAGQKDNLENEVRMWVRDAVERGGPDPIYENTMNKFAGIVLNEVLTMTQGNRSQAAKILGLSRPTLHAKIEKYNLQIETLVKKMTPT